MGKPGPVFHNPQSGPFQCAFGTVTGIGAIAGK
jgi:hypothetical protein